MNLIVSVIAFLLVFAFLYLAAATIYLLVLSMAYFVLRERTPGPVQPLNRFAIIVPAHNEELLVGTLCQSLLQVNYPKGNFEIFIVADNCSDQTADICRHFPLHVLERHDPDNCGKGQALAWGLQQISLELFDAVFIVDADNYVDPAILLELSRLLNQGEQAIQCYNAVGNRDDSWFTQLLFVSRTIANLLYHEAKFRWGLSSYLMGNGLCFKSELLQKRGWTAFSTGEDWEYYSQLVESKIKIAFAAKARVFHQESRSLNQATSQRLRWSSGRFRIARTLGLRLFVKGIKERNWLVFDASLALIFPNYSLQVNLTICALFFAFLLSSSALKVFFVIAFLCLLAGQFLLFVLGAFIAGSCWKIFSAMLYVPIFLVWKSVIDLLCFTGLYRGKKWVRTRRHQSQLVVVDTTSTKSGSFDMKKTRILFVMLQLDAGGSERVIFDLARSLDRDRFEIYIVAFKGGVLSVPLKRICEEVLFIEKKPGFDISAMFKLANIVRKYRIDVVNAHHYMPCFYSFLGTRIINCKRLIYTEHSIPEVESIAGSFHGKIFHFMLYRINGVVGVSRAITDKFLENYPHHAHKFHEILNGVDIEKFRVQGGREEARSRWGLTKDHFVVGTVANFRRIKNHACLVRAAARLKASHPQLRLFFVGTGFSGDPENSEDKMRSLISELGLQGRVVFAGYQENIPSMLSALDVFCLPSFSEGLPVSLLEAMAAGVPVIGSEVAGIDEVVTHGKTGLLFPSDDDERLSLLFARLMMNPDDLSKLVTNGNLYIAGNHSIEAWQDKYVELFRNN